MRIHNYCIWFVTYDNPVVKRPGMIKKILTLKYLFVVVYHINVGRAVTTGVSVNKSLHNQNTAKYKWAHLFSNLFSATYSNDGPSSITVCPKMTLHFSLDRTEKFKKMKYFREIYVRRKLFCQRRNLDFFFGNILLPIQVMKEVSKGSDFWRISANWRSGRWYEGPGGLNAPSLKNAILHRAKLLPEAKSNRRAWRTLAVSACAPNTGNVHSKVLPKLFEVL